METRCASIPSARPPRCRVDPPSPPLQPVTPGVFERISDGAMADHCHKANPRIATSDAYRAMLEASM